MNRPTESYLKVHYELRPAKQVERRMLIDAFQLLALSDFSIKDYQYTGMGSIYFIDFVLFHRFLGITRMLSVEYSAKIAKRIEFNRPFRCVETVIAPISDVIPTLSKDHKHILWLDYDGVLANSHLQDISLAATFLSVGSLLLVTVDIEPPTPEDEPKEWRNYYREQAAEYFDGKLSVSAFSQSKLAKRNLEIIERAIKSGLTGRSGVDFIPLFNFVYQDGHRMLTIGGMIGTRTELRKIKGSPLAEASYHRKDFELPPCIITVPRLTRKERQYLDRHMPCDDSWSPPEFELSSESVLAYREIYRFCPAYAEFMT